MPALVGADDGAGPRLPMDDDEPPAHNRPAAATPGRHGEPRAPQAASLPPALSWAAEHEAGEILDRLAATDAGLTEREAAARLATCGRNRIAASQGPHWLASLARRLSGSVNVMLIVLSALSVFVHDYSAAALIGRMIVLSVTLATWQETRSDRAVAALRTMVHTTIALRRPGRTRTARPARRSAQSPSSFRSTSSTWRQETWCPPTSGCWPRRTCS